MRARVSCGVVVSLMVSLGCAQPESDASSSASDSTITTNLKQKFAADDHLKGRNIEVTTQNAVVRLGGTVENADEKTQAVKIARATQGVTDVLDYLTIGPTGGRASAATEPTVTDEPPVMPELMDTPEGTIAPGSGEKPQRGKASPAPRPRER